MSCFSLFFIVDYSNAWFLIFLNFVFSSLPKNLGIRLEEIFLFYCFPSLHLGGKFFEDYIKDLMFRFF